jgi:hypothetical protein
LEDFVARTRALSIASALLVLLSAGAADAVVQTNVVQVIWEEDGITRSSGNISAGSSYSIDRDVGTDVDIIVHRRSDSGPVQFFVHDTSNLQLLSYPEIGTTTSMSHRFNDAVGPLESLVRAYAGTADGAVTINVRNIATETPDLVVTGIQVDNTTSPQTYQVGQEVNVEAIVLNQGDGTAGSSRLAYYIGTSSSDTSDLWDDDGVRTLDYNQGDSENADYTFHMSDVGTRYFVLEADYEDDVDEGDGEDNNIEHFGPFQVLCTPPGTPAGPVPANGETLASPPTLLNWTSSSGAFTYDVYLDGTRVAHDLTDSDWTVSTTIGIGQHTWYVVAINQCGSTQGPNWQFTVEPPPGYSVAGVVSSRRFPYGGIPGATVEADTGESTTTAWDGSYTLSDVPAGTRTITASRQDYWASGSSNTASQQVSLSGGATGIDFADFACKAVADVQLGVDQATVQPGGTFNVTISLTNQGPLVADVLSYIDLSFDSQHLVVGTPSGSGWTSLQSHPPGSAIWAVSNAQGDWVPISSVDHLISAERSGTFPAGATYSVSVPVTVDSGAPSGVITLMFRGTIGDHRDPESTFSGAMDQQNLNAQSNDVQISSGLMGSLWTTITMQETVELRISPECVACNESPLSEDSFGQIVEHVFVDPPPADPADELRLLRSAANKVILNGDWDPNLGDFIPGDEQHTRVTFDLSGNPMALTSPLALDDDDWEMIIDEAGWFGQEDGLGYYDARVEMFKKVISRLVYNVDESQFQSWSIRHSDYLDKVHFVLEPASVTVGMSQAVLKEITEKEFPRLEGTGHVLDALGVVVAIMDSAAAYATEQEMAAMVALAMTLEAEDRIRVLDDLVHSPVAGTYDPAMVAAVEQIKSDFDAYWMDSSGHGSWEDFVDEAVDQVLGSPNWFDYVSGPMFTALETQLPWQIKLGILPWKVGFALLESREAYRAGIVGTTMYRFLNYHLFEGSAFQGDSEAAILEGTLMANSMRGEFAYLAYDCILEYLEDPWVNVGSWMNFGTLGAVRDHVQYRRDQCQEHAEKEKGPWYVAGEVLPSDRGTEDMRWLAGRLHLGGYQCVPPASPLVVASSTASSGSSYLVEWSEESASNRYQVQESDSPEFSGAPVLDVQTTSVSFSNTVSAESDFYYRVRAVNICDGSPIYSPWSDTVQVTVELDCFDPPVPWLVAPTSSTAGEAFIVVWAATSEENTYELQESQEPTFSAPLTTQIVGTESTIVQIVPATVYFRVRAVEGCGAVTLFSQWSETAETRVGSTCEAPSTPEAYSPFAARSGLQFAVSWSQTSPDDRYQVQESVDPGFLGATTTETTGSSLAFTHAVQADTQFFYRVRALDECGGSTFYSEWSASTQTTVLAPCGPADPPQVQGPSHAVSGNTYQVTWTDTGSTHSYEIQESEDAGFSSVSTWGTIGTSTYVSHTVSVSTPFFYRVRAVDHCEGQAYYSSFSNTWMTTVDPSVSSTIFQGDFESGNLSRWSSSTGGGGGGITESDVIRWYDFGGGSGSNLVDSSLNAQHLSIVNATWSGVEVPGSRAYSLDFDGSGDYCVGPSTRDDVAGLDEFSVFGWFRVEDWHRMAVCDREDPGNTVLWNLFYDGLPASDNMKWDIHTNAGAFNTRGGSAAMVPGSWHFVVTTYDGRTMEVHLDGQLVQSFDTGSDSELVSSAAGTSLFIGRNNSAAPSHDWLGNIAQVGIVAKVLSPDTIGDLYNGGQGVTYDEYFSGP